MQEFSLLLEKLCEVRLSDQNRSYCRRMLDAARQAIRERSLEVPPVDPSVASEPEVCENFVEG